MPILNVNTPPPNLVALSAVGRGQFFRSSGTVYVVAGTATAGNVPMTNLLDNAISSLPQTTMVEVLQLDEASFTVL